MVTGAVYSPFTSVPTCGVNDQVTAVLALPLTAAVNCCTCPCRSVTDVGLTFTTNGASVTVAEAEVSPSAALVAVMVTVCGLLSVAGAVYRPFTNVPVGGVTDQFTAVFVLPVTVAVNCWVCPWDKLTEPGVTLICGGGLSVTTAEPEVVPSAVLVAVMVIFCWLAILAGAVYNPLTSVPVTGVIDQITDVLELPVTVAVNCLDCAWNRFTPAGVTVTLSGGNNVTVAVANEIPSAALIAFTVTIC